MYVSDLCMSPISPLYIWQNEQIIGKLWDGLQIKEEYARKTAGENRGWGHVMHMDFVKINKETFGLPLIMHMLS